MKKIKSAIAAATIFLLLTSSGIPCSNSDVTIIGSNYSVPLLPSNNGGWAPPTEYYTGFWVMNDGGYYRTDYYHGNYPSQPTALTQPVSGNVLAFSTVSNRKGDDGDKKKISGGYVFNSTNSPPDLFFTSYPLNQHMNSGSSITAINTDHGSNYGLRSNEFMLVITINNDSGKLAIIDQKAPDATKYKLHLYHSISGINYSFIQGNASGNYPCGNNQYFAFANTSTNTFAYNGLTEIKSWVIESNFSGHQKNVYCLLTVPAGDFTSDNFTALITDGGNNLVQSSASAFPVTFGNSLDPNSIEVNKDTSNICGSRPEQLTYTVHFQNTGAAMEDSVNVNLELDPALDAASFEVLDAGVGSTFHVTNTAAPISKVADYNFSCGTATHSAGSNHPHFQYSLNSGAAAILCAGSVAANITFRFAGVALQGISYPQVGETEGYIRFKVNAVRPYSSIHNRAGIFFCGNSNRDSHGSLIEVITNLAVTNCNHAATPDSSCAAQLDQCHQQLQECKSNCHDWKYWLGWVIAGVELLLLIFLLLQKRK